MLSDLLNAYRYRYLIAYLTLGRIRSGERDKAFGRLWSLLDPIFNFGIYFFVFDVLFESGVEHFPSYLFCAIIAWRLLSKSVSAATGCIPGHYRLVTEAYFPKSVLPISIVLMNANDYLWGLGTLILISWVLDVPFGPIILFWPVVLTVQLVLTLGLSILAAVFGVFFRDLGHVVDICFRLLFYFSGTMYSISRVPDWLQPYFLFNPVYILFESYRNLLLHQTLPPLGRLGGLALVSLALLWWALRVMARREGQFMKYL